MGSTTPEAVVVDGPSGATLGGTTTAALDGTGIATFASLSVDTAGLDAKLKAEGGSGSVISDAFDIVSATCTTNGVDCSATTDPNGTGATPSNNTVGAVTVVDNGTGSGDGSLLVKLDGASSCTGAVGTPVGQALLVVPSGFAGAFAKVTVTYDASITPNASWKYKFCVDKGGGVVKPNIPLCLVGALGYSDKEAVAAGYRAADATLPDQPAPRASTRSMGAPRAERPLSAVAEDELPF